MPLEETIISNAEGENNSISVVENIELSDLQVSEEQDIHTIAAATGVVTEHNQLDGRDAADQHPIGAISGLQAALAGKQNIAPVFPITNFSFASNNTEFSFDINQESLEQLKANTARTIILKENNGSGYEGYYTFILHSQLSGGKVYICNTTKTATGNGLSTLSFYLADSHTNNTIWGQAYSQLIKDVDIDTFDASTGTLYLRYNVIDANITWFNYPVETITPEQEAAIISLLPSRSIVSVKTLKVTKASNEYIHINNITSYLVDHSNTDGTIAAFPVKTQITGNDPISIWTDENYYYIIMNWTVDGDTDTYLVRATFEYGASGDSSSIDVDLYFSDFDLSGSVPVVTNQEKAEKLKSILAKDDKDFIYLFADFPYLVESENVDNEFGGKMSFYVSYFLNLKAFISLSSGSANSQVILFAERDNELAATILQFPEWYTEALFTAMATDATKHISLKFTVGAGSSVSPNPEPVAGGSGGGGSGDNAKLYSHTFTYQLADLNFTVNLINSYNQSYGTGLTNLMTNYLAHMVDCPNFVKDWIWQNSNTTFRRPILDLSTNLTTYLEFYIIDYATGEVSPLRINFSELLNADTITDTVVEYPIGTNGGGSSGSSPVLYRHRTLVKVYESSGEGGSTQQAMISFLSKYSDPFVTDGSLVDLFTWYADYSDEHGIINPMLIIGNTFYYINNIKEPNVDGIDLVIGTSTRNIIMTMSFSDNASGLTDVVTPYIEVSGGSGTYPKIKEINANDFLTDNQILQFLQVYATGSGCAFLTSSNEFMTSAEFEEYDMIRVKAYVNGILAFDGLLPKQAFVPVKAYGLSIGKVASTLANNCQVYLYLGSSSGNDTIDKLGINAVPLSGSSSSSNKPTIITTELGTSGTAKIRLTFFDLVYSPDWYFDETKSALETVAQMAGVTIPTITKQNLNQVSTTVYQALYQADPTLAMAIFLNCFRYHSSTFGHKIDYVNSINEEVFCNAIYEQIDGSPMILINHMNTLTPVGQILDNLIDGTEELSFNFHNNY